MVVISTSSLSLLDKVPDSLLERISNQKDKPTLDLSLCLLTRVPLDVIQLYYGRVDSLNLSCNHLRSLPPKFALKLNTMTKLNLKRNDLKRLPDNFGDLENLLDLNISDNKLETLPLSMGKLKQLESLALSGNSFQYPLSSFLDTETELDPFLIAPSVVQLLATLSQEMFPSHGIPFITSFQRWVTFEDDDEALSTLNGGFERIDDSNYMLAGQNADTPLLETETDQKSSAWNTFFLRVMGAVGFLMLLCLLPLISASFYSTHFIEYWTKNNANLEYIWSIYKPYHTSAENALRSVNILPYIPFYNYFGAPSRSQAEFFNDFIAYIFG